MSEVLKHTRFIYISTEELGVIYFSCPFDKWDIVGKLPKASRERSYIIVAVDYFTRWVEAENIAKIDEKIVKKFLWKNICCRF